MSLEGAGLPPSTTVQRLRRRVEGKEGVFIGNLTTELIITWILEDLARHFGWTMAKLKSRAVPRNKRRAKPATNTQRTSSTGYGFMFLGVLAGS